MALRCVGVFIRKELSGVSPAVVRNFSTSQTRNRFLEGSPNTILDKTLLNRYKTLNIPKDKVQVTYLWVDGTGENIRLKDRVVNFVPKSAEELPKWQYDGSSTYQAMGQNSDTTLVPRAMYKDPFKPGPNDVIAMCDTYQPDGKPTVSNQRNAMQDAVEQAKDHEPMFGIEQEYTLLDVNGRPFGWPNTGFPAPQGPYYCGVGADRVFARDIVEAHAIACLYAGIDFGGTNAEVMPAQWEYQVGPSIGMKVADDLWVSSENDLAKPTEKFVFNALLSYLEVFNIDTSRLLQERSTDDGFKVKFCKYVDRYYKISDKTNYFVYYDLVQPSPKKTVHMLKYLLNYWLYYNMMKTEIITTAQEKIKAYEKISENRNNALAEKEKLEIKSKTIEMKLNEYSVMLPKLKSKLSTLKNQEKSQQKKIQELNEAIKISNSTLVQLRNSEEELRSVLVAKEEVDSLKENLNSLKKLIEKEEEIETITLSNNQTRSATIKELELLIQKVESCMKMHPPEDLLSANAAKPKVDELMRQHTLMDAAIKKSQYEVEELSNKVEEIQKNINSKRKHMQDIVENYRNQIFIKKQNFEKMDWIRQKLSDELADIESLLFTQKRNLEYILEMAEKTYECLL